MLIGQEYFEAVDRLLEMIENGDITYIADDTYVTQETGYRKKFSTYEIVEYVWKLMQE